MAPREKKDTKRRTGGRERSSRFGETTGKRRSHLLEGVKKINGNDADFLRKFTTEHGKIVPSRLTGASAKQQRTLKRYVRRARVMGLVP